MGQIETLNVLKENKTWMTSSEIANKLNVERSSVNANLRRLEKAQDVIKKKTENKHRIREYLWKIKNI